MWRCENSETTLRGASRGGMSPYHLRWPDMVLTLNEGWGIVPTSHNIQFDIKMQPPKHLLSLALIALLSHTVSAQVPPTVGDGSIENPYEIATVDNFLWIGTLPYGDHEGKHFVQTADLDFTEQDFQGLVDFAGIYDGRYHQIRANISAADDGEGLGLRAGLFRELNGIVKNLHLDVQIDTDAFISGGLAAQCFNCIVERVRVTGLVRSSSENGLAGGIVGQAEEALFMEVVNTATVFADWAAGFAAEAVGLGVLDSYHLGALGRGTVAATDTRAGGIIAFLNSHRLSDDTESTVETTLRRVYASYCIANGDVSDPNTFPQLRGGLIASDAASPGGPVSHLAPTSMYVNDDSYFDGTAGCLTDYGDLEDAEDGFNYLDLNDPEWLGYINWSIAPSDLGQITVEKWLHTSRLGFTEIHPFMDFSNEPRTAGQQGFNALALVWESQPSPSHGGFPIAFNGTNQNCCSSDGDTPFDEIVPQFGFGASVEAPFLSTSIAFCMAPITGFDEDDNIEYDSGNVECNAIMPATNRGISATTSFATHAALQADGRPFALWAMASGPLGSVDSEVLEVSANAQLDIRGVSLLDANVDGATTLALRAENIDWLDPYAIELSFFASNELSFSNFRQADVFNNIEGEEAQVFATTKPHPDDPDLQEVRLAVARSMELPNDDYLVLFDVSYDQNAVDPRPESFHILFNESYMDNRHNYLRLDEREFIHMVRRGDVDGNGMIRAYDAALILSHVVNGPDYGNELWEARAYASDVDLNEQITSTDAVPVLQYVVGINPCMPFSYGCEISKSAPLADAAFTPVGSIALERVSDTEVALLITESGVRTLDLKLPGYRGLTVSAVPDGVTYAVADPDRDVAIAAATATTIDVGARFMITGANAGTLSPSDIAVTLNGHEAYVRAATAGNIRSESFSLYPNPARADVNVSVTLQEGATFELAVFDLLGRRVMTVDQGYRGEGSHQFTLPAERLASGVYLTRLTINDITTTKQMVIAR